MNRRSPLAVPAAATTSVVRVATPPAAATPSGEEFYPAICGAAGRHGTSGDWLGSTMRCKSGGDPAAWNPQTGESGLFQFHQDTCHGIFGVGYADHWVCSGIRDGDPS